MPEPQPTYVVVDIGCLECGNPSALLYVGRDIEDAKEAAGNSYIDVAAENPPEDDYYFANPWRGDVVTALFTYPEDYHMSPLIPAPPDSPQPPPPPKRSA